MLVVERGDADSTREKAKTKVGVEPGARRVNIGKYMKGMTAG